MTESHDFSQRLIIERSVVENVADDSDAPRAISVEVTIDGDRLRGWEEPGWRQVGLGSASGSSTGGPHVGLWIWHSVM
jgi:hypothetical protein